MYYGFFFLSLGRIRPAAIGRPALRKLAASEGRIPAYRILYTRSSIGPRQSVRGSRAGRWVIGVHYANRPLDLIYFPRPPCRNAGRSFGSSSTVDVVVVTKQTISGLV